MFVVIFEDMCIIGVIGYGIELLIIRYIFYFNIEDFYFIRFDFYWWGSNVVSGVVWNYYNK